MARHFSIFVISCFLISWGCSSSKDSGTGGDGSSGKDTIGPAIVNVNPADGDTNVALNAVVTATFSEKLDPATINDSTFTINSVVGTVSYHNLVATFIPENELEYLTTYTVTISDEVTDSSHNRMAGEYTWQFTTVRIPAWEGKQAMPDRRAFLSAAVVRDTVYAIGGSDNSIIYHGTVSAYDPISNTWISRTPMLTPRNEFGAAVLNDTIYAIGGHNAINLLPTVEIFDPATNTWSARASLSTARSGLAAAAVEGKIYAVGGVTNAGQTGMVEEYDPATNTWTIKSDMPTPRAYLAVAAVGGYIYAIGGFSESGGYHPTIQQYNPVNDLWVSKPSSSTSRAHLAAAVVNGAIYVVGGYDGTDHLDIFEFFQVGLDTWTSATDMPTPRSRLAAATVNGKIYVLGGLNAGGYLNIVEEYDPSQGR